MRTVPRDELFLRACRGEPVDRTPVWIMRQAGRYLPEYRELKAKYDFLTLCKTPELATEVTLQPIRRLGVDAAILFSDILVPVEPLGVGLRFDPGPILERPINTEETVEALNPVDPEETLGYVAEAIRLLRRELEVPLIGFAGAPFTVAAYLAEEREKGKAKGTFDTIVRMLFEAPDLAKNLLDRLTTVTADYLSMQIRAGAQAVQIFDSWGGILSRKEFESFALPAVREVIARLPEERGPVIYFVLNGGHLMESIAASGADVVGVDWRTPLFQARRGIASGLRRSSTLPAVPGRTTRFPTAVQGNLDPRALFSPPGRLAAEIRRVLEDGVPEPESKAAGHVFNLGHGILPETPVASAQAVIDLVHQISIELRGGA